jgi:crotonobetainyl-CoA:carnitine CoA-transferase CaiB-like acyl-CoA transferase
LLQAQVFMLDFQAARWLMNGEVPQQAGNNHPTSIPTGVFRTSDGYINIACSGEPMWERLKEVLGDEELNSPDYADLSARQQNRDRLNALIDANMAKDSSANWIEKMTQTGVPCGEINSIDQVFESPAVQHLEMVWPGNSHERGETKYLAQPITMSRSKSGLRTPPPKRGQHSDEILDTLGYSPGEIEGLRAKGVI